LIGSGRQRNIIAKLNAAPHSHCPPMLRHTRSCLKFTTCSTTVRHWLVHQRCRPVIHRIMRLAVLRISGIASHFAPQIQANAMQQHFRISLIAMQNNDTHVTVNAGDRCTAIESRVITVARLDRRTYMVSNYAACLIRSSVRRHCITKTPSRVNTSSST